MAVFIVAVLVLVIAVVIAIRLYMRRAAELRRAHDARLAAMAHAALAAAKKKQAAAAAAAAKQAAEAAAVEAPPAVLATRDERECPFCAEPILKKARVCKHCGRDVEPLVNSPS